MCSNFCTSMIFSLFFLCLMLVTPLCFSFGPVGGRMIVRAMSMNAEVIESVKVCVRPRAAYYVLIIPFLTN